MVTGMFGFRRLAFFLVSAALLALPAATSVADSAQRKFSRLDMARLPAGSRIDITTAELNAWASGQAKIYAPGAARNIRIETRNGEATGAMLLDFLKVRQAATGEEPGWLMRALFSGEKQVIVKARFESRNRKARVDVLRVEVSGVPIEGNTLDFLVRNWLRPTFPDAHINEWFNLGFRIDHFAVTPAGTSVFIGK